ncbi:hypothetical protein RIF29_37047 [Crotalaria pallida]|uniref:Protein kinase domain-containing protein n=1 Tax=Crotalaria pallida TaxID=3830 RepID=A0AAN9ECW1_CROPI
MDWVRGRTLGSGSFATVYLATSAHHHHHHHPHYFPPLFAVKTTYHASTSSSLVNENQILQSLQPSPHIIKSFGFERTVEKGEDCCNMFLEYAHGGTLYDHMKKKHVGGKFPESKVRHYTKSILEGLNHVHVKGFVHCDIKLQNILIFENDVVKIADFGLAKKAGEGEEQSKRCECRGTPMFMSPELFNSNEHEPPADIWALGCAVVEMVTGEPAWDLGPNTNMWALLVRIGMSDEIPKIPPELSERGKDFLRKCFVKDPTKRFTAEMLLKHPFVSGDDTVSMKLLNNEPITISPKSHLDKFPHWVSTVTTVVPSSPSSTSSSLAADRLRQLVTEETLQDWSDSEGWGNVR